MEFEEVERIAMLGAGVMGHSIAQVAAQSGYKVIIRDIAQEFLDKARQGVERNLRRGVDRGRVTEEDARATLGNISMTLDLAEAVKDADLVIEAVPERMDIKHSVWREVCEHAKDEAVLATNTSSLSITEMAEAVAHPRRFIGMHFFNPPTILKLVEVIPGEETKPHTVSLVERVAERMGKTPVVVQRDSPGFIVNRVLITYLNEAAKLLDAYPREQMDSAMQHQAGMPLGPFMLMDLIGLDIVYHILKVFEEKLGTYYKPAEPIEGLYTEKKLGRKTGEGFYGYAERPSVSEAEGEGFDTSLLLDPFIAEAEKVVAEGIARPGDVDTALRLGANLHKGPFEMKREMEG